MDLPNSAEQRKMGCWCHFVMLYWPCLPREDLVEMEMGWRRCRSTEYGVIAAGKSDGGVYNNYQQWTL